MSEYLTTYVSDIQNHIVNDPFRVKLVNGCAGSRKTDTIVKLGVNHIIKYRHNILFLTLVSSITHELKCRLESMLGIEIPRIGSSNHYVGQYDGCFISIANYDAFVHRQLEELGLGDELMDNGDCHDWKTRVLFEATQTKKHARFVMKHGINADFVLVDEFQDMDPLKAKILTNILSNNHDLWGIAVGDIVQSVFPRAVSTDIAMGHPMNIWKYVLDPEIYHIATCYRCPAAHIEFVNLLLSEYYERFGLPKMVSSNTDMFNKPVIFTHDKVSKNQTAYHVAAQVCAAIKEIFRDDPSLKPEDVAIIMKKSNSNYVFEQLKIMLNKIYFEMKKENDSKEDDSEEQIFKESVIHFETRGDGYHNSIDWSKAEGKSVLLSIHGDKGKGHKVVFFLGVSHRCLPMENNLFKTQELIDISLLNVGLTRSTQYLFIGFTADSPSRYISLKNDELQDYAYLGWSSESWTIYNETGTVKYLQHAPPSPYRDAIMAMNNTWKGLSDCDQQPKFDRLLRISPLFCPDKDLLRIVDDIARDASCLFEDIFKTDDFKPIIETFGNKYRTKSVLTEDMIPLLGIMGELLVYRSMQQLCGNTYLKRTFACIMSHDHVRYTDDDRILNIVCDSGLNQHVVDMDLWKYTIKRIIKTHARLMERDDNIAMFFRSLLNCNTRPIAILSSVFASEIFRKQLKVFLGKADSKKIPTRVFWNVSLCFNELCESLRRPCVLLNFNKFNDNIEVLHNNIFIFVEKYLSKDKATLSFQSVHKLTEKETNPEILHNHYGFVNHEHLDADRFRRGYIYGIVGRSDIMNLNSGHVYELKTSSKVDMSREWIAQALLYTCLPYSGEIDAQSSHNLTFSVINIVNGIIYNFKIPEWFDKEEFLVKIFNHYNFNTTMITMLKQKIKDANNK